MTGGMNINGMPSNYWANSWAAQSLYSDNDTFMGIGPIGTDVNPYGSQFGAITNPMGMGGSIMGGVNPMMGGVNPMMGGVNPMMGGVTNMKDYMAKMEEYQDFQIDSQVRRQRKAAAAEFELSSSDDTLTRQIGILQSKIQNNEQDAVLQEYNKLIQTAREKFETDGTLPRGLRNGKVMDRIKAYAEKAYFTETGKSIIDELRTNGDGSFVHGAKHAVTFGLSNNRSVEENIADITGTSLDRTETFARKLGGFFGGAAFGGVIGGLIGAIFHNNRAGAKIGAGIGALGGAAIG